MDSGPNSTKDIKLACECLINSTMRMMDDVVSEISNESLGREKREMRTVCPRTGLGQCV